MSAYDLALLWAGGFLLVGMLTGVWKYLCIMNSAESCAPVYVDIAHRTALLYSFASAVLALLAERSVWTNDINLLGVWMAEIFFAAAVASYVLHGWLRDTDNQLARPHRLGGGSLPNWVLTVFMWALIVAEIGGLVILLSGFVMGLMA